MARAGSADVTVAYDDSPGGTPRQVEDFLLNGFSAKEIAVQMETTGLGDGAREHSPTGLSEHEDISLEGIWDTMADVGPHVVFVSPDNGPNDATRTLTVLVGDSKQWAVETRLVEYEVIIEIGVLNKFKALVRPTGASTWSG